MEGVSEDRRECVVIRKNHCTESRVCMCSKAGANLAALEEQGRWTWLGVSERLGDVGAAGSDRVCAFARFSAESEIAS